MKKVRLKLVGLNGNAWVLLGAFDAAAQREGWTAEERQAVFVEATSGDYEHLVATLARRCVNPGLPRDGRYSEE